MAFAVWLCFMAWTFLIGCGGQSIVTQGIQSSVASHNAHPLLYTSTQISTTSGRASPNPTLVHGLVSPLTTSSHSVVAGRHSSEDYSPLLHFTLSSAYREISEHKKSADSLTGSLEYPKSTLSDNQLFKQSDSSGALDTSSGMLKSTLSSFGGSFKKTLQDGVVQSTPSYSMLNSALPVIEPSQTVTPTEFQTATRIPSTMNSVTISSRIQTSSTNDPSDDFHVSGLNTLSFLGSEEAHVQSSKVTKASEWRHGLLPSVAYDQPFSAALTSSELFHYIDSNLYKTSASSSSVVTFSAGGLNTIPFKSSEIEKSPSSELFTLRESQPQSFLTKSPYASTSTSILISSNSFGYLNYSTSKLISSSDFLTTSGDFNSQTITQATNSFEKLIVPSSSQLHQHTSPISSTMTTTSHYLPSYTSSIPSADPALVTARETTLFTSSPSALIFSKTTEHTPILTSTSVSSLSSLSPTSSLSLSSVAFPSVTTSLQDIITPLMTTESSPAEEDILENCRYLFSFSGDCGLVTNNTLYLAEFIEGLKKTLVEKLDITYDRIKPHDISCKPIKIYVKFKNVSCSRMMRSLKKLVNTSNFIVPTLIENKVITFTAETVRQVELIETQNIDLNAPGGGIDKIDIIVIIIASCICGVLLVIGVTVCVKECYRRKYAQSFDLLDMPHVNLKLEDFTLTRIPRPKTTYNSENSSAHGYPDRYGSQPLSKENGQPAVNGNHVNLNDVHVRMQPLSDGIVVGVTGYTTPKGTSHKKKHDPLNSSSLSSPEDIGNPSTESLVPDHHYSSIGNLNPIFVDDDVDDRGSTSTLDISQAQTTLVTD